MFSTLFQATGYKRVLELFEQGRFEEGKAVLKSLQEEFIAVCEENEALKAQLSEVADVLDLAEKVRFDGQKYWLNDGKERKGPFARSATTATDCWSTSTNTKTTGNAKPATACT